MTRSTRAESAKLPITGSTQKSSKPYSARFGQINFINSLPLTLPLLSANTFDRSTFKLGTPAELNRAYFDGQLDLGAMSSFFFLEQGGLTLIPDVSIASKGAVGSVLFFADKPLDQLADKVLAITADSATSVNLLKVLFAETYGFIPSCQTSSKPEIDEKFAGALVIGDRALHSDTSWSKELVRADLGQWWFEKFGLPMVFGVWAAQDKWVKANQEKFVSICDELRSLFDKGLTGQFDAVLAEAEKRTGLPKSRLEYYFKSELNFDLSKDHLQGLALYAELCRKHGLLPKV